MDLSIPSLANAGAPGGEVNWSHGFRDCGAEEGKARLNQILNLLSQSVKIENRAQDNVSNLLGYSLCSPAMILKN